MESAHTVRRSVRTGVLGASLLAGLVLVTACGQKRANRPPPIDPEQAARLGLTEDAQDPTQRDKDQGYYLWKTKPEPAGTDAPTSPDRRKIGGPSP